MFIRTAVVATLSVAVSACAAHAYGMQSVSKGFVPSLALLNSNNPTQKKKKKEPKIQYIAIKEGGSS